MTQLGSKALNISWKLHCAYRPQSSGQVERMNRTVKSTLSKLVWETGEGWTSLLPFALLRARCTPYKAGFTPFEIMFGRPPPLLPKLADVKKGEINNRVLLKSLQSTTDPGVSPPPGALYTPSTVILSSLEMLLSRSSKKKDWLQLGEDHTLLF